MKTLTIREFASIKRVAMNVNPLVVKKNKIAAKINELNKEYNDLIEEIEGHEMGVKAKTGGFISEELISKRVEDTGKVDKDGKPIKKTIYEPKEGVVTFNKETNLYELLNNPLTMAVNGVPMESIDDAEIAPEVEIKDGEESPIDPTNPFGNAQEAEDKLPFED